MARARLLGIIFLSGLLLSGGVRPAGAAAFAQQVVNLTNVERVKMGLPTLQTSTSLTSSAQSYATAMATYGFYSDIGLDGSTFIQRDEAAGYVGWTYLAESIGAGQTSANAIVAAWMADPAHRAILLSPSAREVGVGYTFRSSSPYGTYWVLEVGNRPNLPAPVIGSPVVFLPIVAR